jgi:hypothetical protein
MFSGLRQNLAMWGYNNSQFLRFTEEALAEGIATRSVWQGLAHPIVNPYGISSTRLSIEAIGYGTGVAGSIYGTYRLVESGNEDN